MPKNPTTHPQYIIRSGPEEITHGLFGGIISFVFEILPYLKSRNIYPYWDIRSRAYGVGPDLQVIPGVLDLAYAVDPLTVAPDFTAGKPLGKSGETLTPPNSETGESQTLQLADLRASHVSALGNNWQELHDLWFSYFNIPKRIIDACNHHGDLSCVLGIHYRGTDKNQAGWDTNPVTPNEYIQLIKDYLQTHTDINTLFIATDEPSFFEHCAQSFPLLRHLRSGAQVSGFGKADYALLDSYTLSKCRTVLMTSSALSAFAKLFNPALECYRVAASKLYASNPYFPIAYIPRLHSDNADCQALLDKLFIGDWHNDIRTNRKFKTDFSFHKRKKAADLQYEALCYLMKARNKLFK